MYQLVIFSTVLIWNINANAEPEGCCRKRVNCYMCDSRIDPNCGDSFNTTNVSIGFCDELCVKLKYKHDDKFYYIRNCAESLKKISLKKTDVCYSTRAHNGGYLCFCEQDLCNSSISTYFASNLPAFLLLFILLFNYL